MSENSFNFNDFPIIFDYEKISKEKTFLAITRLLASNLMENPYLTIGTFLNNISDYDLREFLTLIENSEDSAMENLLVITEMLAGAEGIKSENIDQLTARCNIMIGYITIESLKRRGLVKVYYNNMSFGNEYSNKIIVERNFDV